MPTTLVKECAPILIPVLTRIINLSLTTSTMPVIYKTAMVRPLLKKPSLERTIANYRPVSNLPFVSKLIEKCVVKQLSEHMAHNKLGELYQSAYKAAHSTETVMIKVLDDICRSLDSNRIVFMSMLDLSAAFDTVDHNILLRRLDSLLGVRGAALDWCSSYLRDRHMKVSINGTDSVPKVLECSVPQGSILGPRMYNDYTMPLGLLIRLLILLFHGYADDQQLLRASTLTEHDQRSAVEHQERAIKSISGWMYDNKLKLNPDKTEFLVISSARNASKVKVESLNVGKDTINRVNVVRNLGILMDTTLSMHAQVANVRKVCYYYITWIRRVRNSLTRSAAKSLVHALIISRLDYCNSVYINIPHYLVRELQLVMNDAARVVMGIRRDPNISISDVLAELHWLPMSQRIDFKILSMVYKALNGLAPEYISSLLVCKSQKRRLRSSNGSMLEIPRTNKSYGDRAFSVVGPKLWNRLPSNIKNQTTFSSFKK